MKKSQLKIDLRKVKKENRLDQVANMIWDRYKDDVRVTGEIYSHRTKQWESREMTKDQFKAAFKSFVKHEGREPTMQEIKRGIKRYEQSQFYMGHAQRLEHLSAKDLFESTETGEFNKSAYTEFRAKALRNKKTGRFEKFDASKLQYVKEGYIINNEGQKQHYRVQSYNGVYMIYWQSPSLIQITDDISFL